MEAEGGLTALLDLPDERILKAVEKAGNRAAAQDVAALAGVNISAARTGLQTLASLTGGDLEVTEGGEIVYNFPKDFRDVLRSRSTAVQAREAFDKVWPYLFYGVRVSFGIFLVASIIIIFTAIVALSTAASSSSDSDDRRRSRGGGMPMFNTRMYWGPSPFDFFYYRPYYGYYSMPRSQRDANKMNFLESTFSYIFGDGDPNQDLQRKRLQLIASVIRNNGGAVVAEQLAPYLDPPAPDGGQTNVEESWVLPAVTALQGVPQVTEEGDIVYTFPELQTSALKYADPELSGAESMSVSDLKQLMQRRGVPTRGEYEKSAMVQSLRKSVLITQPPPALNEEELQFSVAPAENRVAAGVLGVVNLGGALYLRGLLASSALSAAQLGGYLALVQGALPLLLGYAVAFNAIPVFRWFTNKSKNAEIQKRNRSREAWAARLQNRDPTVQRKIQAAKKMSTKLKILEASDVAYTTAKELADQPDMVNALEQSFDDFDRRLRR